MPNDNMKWQKLQIKQFKKTDTVGIRGEIVQSVPFTLLQASSGIC